MTYSHPSTGLSIECSVLPPEIVEAFGSAMTFVCEQIERQDQGPQAFARLEEGLMDQVFAIARSALRGCIEARDDGNKPIRRDGEAYYRAAPANKVINTLFGPVTYARSRYRTASGRSSFAPVDESLGLFDDYLTASVAYRCLLVLDHCATRDAAALLRKLGGMNPSASQLHRLGEVAGRLWKEKGEAAMDAIRKAERIPAAAVSFAVSLDGVMVPILPHEDGREDASWREASCGTISFHDADGTRLDTLYLAQMPEAGKVTLKRQLNDEVAHIRKVRALTSGSSHSPMRLPTTGHSSTGSNPTPALSTTSTPASMSPSSQTSQAPPTSTRDTERSCATTPTAWTSSSAPSATFATRPRRRTRISTGNAHSFGRTGIACAMRPCRPTATPSAPALSRRPTRFLSPNA